MSSKGALTALVPLLISLVVFLLMSSSWLWYRLRFVDRVVLVSAPSFVISSTVALLMIRRDKKLRTQRNVPKPKPQKDQTLVDLLRRVRM